MTTAATPTSRVRSSSTPPEHNEFNVSLPTLNAENTRPINGSRTPPTRSTAKKMLVTIGQTEYVMTVYVNNTKVAITDSATMAKVQELAKQLIDEITAEKANTFDGKIVKDITDKGLFDMDNNLIHAFPESGNNTWNLLKETILYIQSQSLQGSVKIGLEKNSSSRDTSTTTSSTRSKTRSSKVGANGLTEDEKEALKRRQAERQSQRLQTGRKKNRLF